MDLEDIRATEDWSVWTFRKREHPRSKSGIRVHFVPVVYFSGWVFGVSWPILPVRNGKHSSSPVTWIQRFNDQIIILCPKMSVAYIRQKKNCLISEIINNKKEYSKNPSKRNGQKTWMDTSQRKKYEWMTSKHMKKCWSSLKEILNLGIRKYLIKELIKLRNYFSLIVFAKIYKKKWILQDA